MRHRVGALEADDHREARASCTAGLAEEPAECLSFERDLHALEGRALQFPRLVEHRNHLAVQRQLPGLALGRIERRVGVEVLGATEVLRG